jgi:protein-disulfide isomerase
MFGIGARSERVVDNVAGLVGVDLADVDLAANDARINANLGLGLDLDLDGTPSFVIGDRIFVGQVSYETLKAAVEAELAGR